MINDATVTTANLSAENGVVHVLNKVLIQTTVGVKNNEADLVKIYPNPTSDILNVQNSETNFNCITLVDAQGRIVLEADLNDSVTQIDTKDLKTGNYTVHIEGTNSMVSKNLLITTQK